MKKAILITGLVLLVGLANAKPVDPSRARQVAESLLGKPVVQVNSDRFAYCYLYVGADSNGFALVAADDCVRPVLAYSERGQFPVESMPAHVAAWVEGYQREIADLVKCGATPGPKVQAMWVNPKQGGYRTVAPMMSTTWNQSPLYNDMCPYSDTDSAHAVTGCVATAQAQVMKFWNHPAQGYGSHSYVSENFGPLSANFDTLYRWDLMPNALDWSSTDEQVRAVAQLMYHVGVSVEMNYSVSGSGSYTVAYRQFGYNMPSSERALREHFGYSPLLEGRVRRLYSDERWGKMVRDEVVRGNPVLYSGADNTGAHAFVLDGCDSIGMFHLNWGWGGYFDGYYTIDSLSPGAGGAGGNATYTFNMQNTAIFGLRPCYNDDSMASINLVTSDSSKGVVVGSGLYVPYTDTVHIAVVAAEGYRFSGWAGGSSLASVTFVPNGDLTDTALFEPVGGDTVAYCDDFCSGRWRDDYGPTTEWGIRIPASIRNNARSLEAVQLYVYEEGSYTMNIYCGDSICDSTLVFTMQPYFGDAERWITIPLDNPVAVPDNQDVWVTFRFVSYSGYPATASPYTAASDGCWYRMPNGWQPIDQTGVNYTWMIRAIFAPRLCHVSVENAGYCELDNLYGAGDYRLGDTVTVGCNDGYFSHWVGIDSEATSLTFVASGDTAFYAYCNEVGVDEAVSDDAAVEVAGRMVSVHVSGEDVVSLYDMWGRLLATGCGTLRCRVPSAGVYLLRCSASSARKVVVL